MTTINVYAPITKSEKDPETGFVTVYGKMTGPDLDLDEQRMDPIWLAKAVPEWFESGGNVREMHKTSAVGKGVELTQVGEDWYLKSLIVDAEAIKKVEAGVYTGYSICVRGPRIVKDASARGGRIVGGMIPENSLVDRPCLSSAKFLLAKAVGGAPDELEPRVIGGYMLTKDAAMATDGSVEVDDDGVEVDLIAIARDAVSQWLASEAAEVQAGTGGLFVVQMVLNLLSDLEWAAEADAYDDAAAAMAAVKSLLTTPPQEAEVPFTLTTATDLVKVAGAEDAPDAAKSELADFCKALAPALLAHLGIDDVDDKIATALTKAATAEDLDKVAARLAKVEGTAMTSGPVRVTPQHDAATTAATNKLDKAAAYRRMASEVTDRTQAAAYRAIADQLDPPTI